MKLKIAFWGVIALVLVIFGWPLALLALTLGLIIIPIFLAFYWVIRWSGSYNSTPYMKPSDMKPLGRVYGNRRLRQ